MRNIEIILRDADGTHLESVSMDCSIDDLTLELTADGEALESFIERGARYKPPGPQPRLFSVHLEATADNLTREVGARVIAREPTGAADAEFLRGLAAILIGCDGDRLREAADRFDALEQEIQDRANAQLQLVADRERLIYWLLQYVLEADYPNNLCPGASLCLADLSYPPSSDRAKRMLELGEPGRRGGPTLEPTKPLSELEQRIHDELNARLSRHVGKLLTPRALESIRAEALEIIAELAGGVGPLPQFEIEQDPDNPSRITIRQKGRL